MRYNHTHDLVASKRDYKRVLYTKNNEKKLFFWEKTRIRIYWNKFSSFLSIFFSDERTHREKPFGEVLGQNMFELFVRGSVNIFCCLKTPSKFSEFFGNNFHAREKFFNFDFIFSKVFSSYPAQKYVDLWNA